MSDTHTELAVGIDLGTTFSVVSHIDRNGRPWTVMNSEGDITTPSVVFFDKKSVVVGKEAAKVAEYEPERSAQFAKRDMGRDTFRKQIRGEEFPPEVVQALILKKLKEDAELKLGDFSKVVVTVPAYYNEPMRQATQVAGKLAGLDVLDIINEPTAAAISFGVQQGFLSTSGESTSEETILVYDLGGGTFDATIMVIDGQNYKALATLGDVYLGGIDWDRRIVNHIAQTFVEEHGVDPREDPAGMQTLMQEAEDAKHSLSSREETTIRYAFNGQRISVDLTRDEFETMTGDLLDRTLMTLRKLLREVKLEWKDITRLLLVGGSSRMPMIHNMLEEESGLSVDRSLSPDEAVAHGAAIYASLLLGSPEATKLGMSVQNVNSHDLGVLGVEAATGMKRRQIMIPRNTSLPATGVRKFKTFKETQRSVAVNVVEGGDASGNNATQIGKCVVKDLPNLPAKTPVEVIFKYSPNGMLTVAAWLPSIKKKAQLEIERNVGLSNELFEAWAKRIQGGLTDASTLELEPAAKSEATESKPEAKAEPAKGQKSEPKQKAKPASVAAVAATKEEAKPQEPVAKGTSTDEPKPQEPAKAAVESSDDPATKETTVAEESSQQETSPQEKAAEQPLVNEEAKAVEAAKSEATESVDSSGAAELEVIETDAQVADEQTQPVKAKDAENSKEEKPQSAEKSKDKPASAKTKQKEGPSVSLVVAERTEEEEAEEAARNRKRQFAVLGMNTALHALALLILALIILPAKTKENFTVISSRVSDDQLEEEIQEEVELEQPEQIETETKMEVVNDIVSDSNETLELDISDLEPSSVAPDPNANAPAPVAKVTGEMGGRSKAGKTALVNKYGGNAQSEAAVQYGLRWLARHQASDGSWSFDHTHGGNCDCDQPGSMAQTQVGATAMALMAYLAAGHTYYTGTFHKNVTAGLNYIMANGKMTENGADFRGVAEGNSGMYVHGIVTIALCEALAMNDEAIKVR
ncbi:MAG: hypothetical protein CMJ78_11540, partial [Planctomycetaceae bacterium]|nr:hypothetical protein [Planctomycetaceae bacterium]